MRSSLWGFALFGLLAAAPARAQDTVPADDPARAQLLRQRIEDRFAERAKEEVGLTDAQLARLRETSATYGGRRRDLAAQERMVRSSLSEQMRPGVAANQDRVSKLTDDLVNLRSAYAQTFRDENADMAKYLTPVQRSQVLEMRERFVRRVQEIRRQRQAQGQPLRGEMRERRQERRQAAPPPPPPPRR